MRHSRLCGLGAQGDHALVGHAYLHMGLGVEHRCNVDVDPRCVDRTGGWVVGGWAMCVLGHKMLYLLRLVTGCMII